VTSNSTMKIMLRGDPVVLIHGYPLSGASWEKQIPALLAAGAWNAMIRGQKKPGNRLVRQTGPSDAV
jgi:pimeloyl-ACP methyl ester carboxylesterase